MRTWILSCFLILFVATNAQAMESAEPEKTSETSETSWFQLRTIVELGFVAPLSHKIQQGKNGTYFDYVNDGGQDNLFNFARASVEAKFNKRHIVTFLLQPLDLQSRVALKDDLIVQNVTFPAGTALDLRYGFPYYRLSYMYDILGSDRTELAFGASFQFRNATIDFTSVDGSLIYTSRDVGPVPILKMRFTHHLDNGLWFGFEADGFYAPGAIFNLRDNDVLGAILDASLRVGLRTSDRYDTFLNMRYVGGGSDGTNDNPNKPGDGYTKNWIHLATVSLGVTYDLF